VKEAKSNSNISERVKEAKSNNNISERGKIK
jgi:hypothetical protein